MNRRKHKDGYYEPLKKSNLLVHFANLNISYWKKNLCCQSYLRRTAEISKMDENVWNEHLSKLPDNIPQEEYSRNTPRIFSALTFLTALTFGDRIRRKTISRGKRNGIGDM